MLLIVGQPLATPLPMFNVTLDVDASGWFVPLAVNGDGLSRQSIPVPPQVQQGASVGFQVAYLGDSMCGPLISTGSLAVTVRP